MHFQISGLRHNQLWFAYAKTRHAAEHIANAFRKDDHNRVTITEIAVVSELLDA